MNGSSIRRKILVVDDERVIADTLAKVLNVNGYDASAVYDGTEAVESVRHSPPYALVSGVVMVHMDGVEAAVRIRELLPGCRIVLTSGSVGGAHAVQQACREGHDFHFVPKPCHPVEILHWVKTETGHDCSSCKWCQQELVEYELKKNAGQLSYFPPSEVWVCTCPWCEDRRRQGHMNLRERTKWR